MVKPQFILSLDIGGANTKTSLLSLKIDEFVKQEKSNRPYLFKTILNKAEHLISSVEYFPFWEREHKEFKQILKKIQDETVDIIKKKIQESQPKYDVIVTVTAELSDAFYTKKEGIEIICSLLKTTFANQNVFFINVHGNFVTIEDALNDYLSVSASNWVSTSLVFGEKEKLGILLDMGSTTLDLIPIKDGKPVTIGKNDVDRLLNYELFYTGILRPPVATILHEVTYKNTKCPVSFEEFAIMADVYLILGKINEEQYSCDTPDQREKTIEHSYARLSRVICGDPNLINKEELKEIAINIYNAQKEMVKEAIRKSIDQFMRRFITPTSKIRFNITGLGAHILLEPALLELEIHPRQIFYKGLTDFEHVLSTAICLGTVYLKNLIKERTIQMESLSNVSKK